MKSFTLGIFGLFVSSGLVFAAAGPADNQTVVMHGILRTGLVAIGGETTGIGMETDTGIVELVVSKDFKKRAQAFDEKLVQIRGKKTILTGVETGERPGMDVSQMTVYPKLKKLRGTLVQDFAIGGETTGYRLVIDDDNSIELVFTKAQQTEAQKLFDKKVSVVGLKTKLKGIEIPSRPAIIVEAIKETK
jgi:hypothetical protein